MHLLKLQHALLAALVVAGTLSNASATADDRRQPEHGFDAGTFYPLWSGDVDGNHTVNSTDEFVDLSMVTDIPFDSPPADVETWNVADLGDFESGNASTSRYPKTATLSDGALIKDAYVEVFAVQPSTVAQLTAGEETQYVGSNGSVLGVMDYRVVPPSDSWTLTEDVVRRVELRVDGDRVDTTTETQTPVLEFENLAGDGGEHTLSLVATIAVSLEKRTSRQVETCELVRYLKDPLSTTDDRWGYIEECTTERVVDVDTTTDRIVVSDTQRVTSYALNVDGHIAEYPNGDRGLLLTSERPWAGYTTDTGSVQGAYAFYSARDTAWDTLVERTPTGERVIASPLVPLQVFAYPRAGGSTSHGSIDVLDVQGPTLDTPTLPENVSLDIPSESYTASLTLVTRDAAPASTITVRGLVRGTDIDIEPTERTGAAVSESNLTLTVLNATREAVTVQARLTENATGNPIDTRLDDGYVTIDGVDVDTDAQGLVTRTLPRDTSVVTARYTPDTWWNTTPAYTGDSDITYVRATPIDILGVIYGLGVPIGLLLLAAFIIDRATGAALWPPWRHL